MSKYILEIKPDYEGITKGIMILGAKEDNLFVDTLAVENLEQYTPVDIEDVYDKAYSDGYNKGLEEGKADRKKGCEGCKYEQGGLYDVCNQCCNSYHNQWTAKQTDDEIKVGDEVETKDGRRFVVTTFGSGIDGDIAVGVCADGLGLGVDLEELRKTGRHFDIQSILEGMHND